jgi:hypothetical protein
MVKAKPRNLAAFLVVSFFIFTLTGCGEGESESDPPPIIPGGPAPTGTGAAVLSWSPPVSNTDGSPVDLMGFMIYQGTSSGNLQAVRVVSTIDTTTVIDNLLPGTHFFAVTAVSVTGAESSFSNVESKTIN